MSIVKSKMKVSIVAGIGNQIEDMKEVAANSQQQCIGAKTASKRIADNIKVLVKSIEDDFEKGKIEASIEKGPLDVLRTIKEYVSRTVSACDVTTDHFDGLQRVADGRVQAFSETVKLLDKLRKQEEIKVVKILEAIERGEVQVDGDDMVMVSEGPRLPGVGPGPNIKQQRLAEDTSANVIQMKPRKRKTRLDDLLNKSKKGNGKGSSSPEPG